uniref:Far11/STRP N-terminal domain-containing protein n=1 Tax=Panagrolaimus superbus TaxID=310955 RepID=A0A914Z9X9_9BILA
MSDIDFNYADEDSYETELAELYSYSEMEDWAIGLESFHKYTYNRNLPQQFKSMEVNEKKRFIADVIEMLESTESSIRLEAARLVLYLLQGAFGDFRTTDEEENEVNIDELNFQQDKGTGGYEHDCLLNGAINAYFCYQQGLYPVSC